MFIDSHCHLDFPVFNDDLDDVLVQANKVGVNEFLVPATTYQSWDAVYNLNQKYTSIRVAYGMHPYFLDKQKESDLDLLEEYAVVHNAIAIGEIGLDYWPGSVDVEKQESFLLKQLDIAQNLKLPIVLHARKSYDRLFSLLKKYQLHGGVVHAFAGSQVQAKRFIDLGFVIGIGGTVTYQRAQKVKKLLMSLADEEFILETDSPDMPLSGYQGQRNTPARIIEVAKVISDLRKQSLGHIACSNRRNILNVFNKWNDKEK